MTNASAPAWEAKRTEETRNVEDVIRRAGFGNVDAYRYNSASIRVRVIDEQFEGLSVEERDALIEPILEQLPDQTQADILNLFTFSPSELDANQRSNSLRSQLLNAEFENPSPSML